MKAAADAQHYEKAAAYRDQVRALSRVQARQYVESNRGRGCRRVALRIEGGIACVNLVMMRRRRGANRSFFPSNAEGGFDVLARLHA